MMLTVKQVFWIVITSGFIPLTHSGHVGHREVRGEFCERETFQPECGEHEVILMTYARFGRMRRSKCITDEVKNGCSLDVRDLLDRECSGRRSCAIQVATIPPEDNHACLKNYRGYLEVAYRCVKVIHAPKDFCGSTGAVEVREQHGYLSSAVTKKTGCGSLDSPWWVTVKPGQQLRMRLLNFGSNVDESFPLGDLSHTCHVYAVIKEQAVNSETVCASTVRESLVYTSVTNMVEIRLVTPRHKEGADDYFLLEFEALGCPNLLPPTNGWTQRVGSNVYVGCNDTREHTHRWKMTCEGSKWVGDWRNCTHASGKPARASSIQGWTLLTKSHGISIIVIIGIAVSVGLCILLFGLIYIRRHRRREASVPGQGEYTSYDSRTKHSLQPQHDALDKSDVNSSEYYPQMENDYYRTWQMQRHGPAQSGTSVVSKPLPPPPPYVSGSGTLASGTVQPWSRTAAEHIYESPKFVRKTYDQDAEFDSGGTRPAEYYELDPDSSESPRGEPVLRDGSM